MASGEFDVVIIGGGQAGIPLAWAVAAKGQSVALVERKDLGGSCVNFGCTPTKAAIASAKVAHMARRSRDFGIRVGNVEVDYEVVLARAREIALGSRKNLERSFAAAVNPKLIEGHAKLDGREGERFRIRVGDDVVLAKQAVLNTGSRSEIPEIKGLREIPFLHAGNWLDPHMKPSHVVTLGSSYIAVEMSQFYRRLGFDVTVLVRSGEILRKEDPDVAAALRELLESEGIRFLTRTQLRSVKGAKTGLTLEVEENGVARKTAASHVFVATGRKPNTDDLGLETVGLSPRPDGVIPVDHRLASAIPGIWVAGDIRGGPQFTHTSWDDYRILESQLCGRGNRTTDRVLPYAIFTDPELGRVGPTETELNRAGKRVKSARFEMRRNGKAHEIGEDQGFIKVVADEKSGEILGAAVLSANGAELVHLFIDLMNAKAPYTVMRDAVHIHPTLAEAVQSAVAALG